MAITLRQLEIFAAVVAHGSFRRCGEALGMSQVSVSDHMRSLEANLGIRLFERQSGGPVRLSPAGQRAALLAPDLLAHAGDFVDGVVNEDRAAARPFRVAMHGFLLRNLGPVVESWNHEQARHILIRSDETEPVALARQVGAGELDAMFFLSNDGAEVPGSQLVGHEPLGIFVHRDHPLAALRPATAADLRATPAVNLSPDRYLRPLIDRALHAVGVSPISSAVETGEFGLILNSLNRGSGFTCMFHTSTDLIGPATELVEVQFETPLPALQIRLLARRGLRSDALFRSALRMLAAGIASGA